MKENNKYKLWLNVLICSIATFLKGVYFASDEEVYLPHSGLLGEYADEV